MVKEFKFSKYSAFEKKTDLNKSFSEWKEFTQIQIFANIYYVSNMLLEIMRLKEHPMSNFHKTFYTKAIEKLQSC